VTAGGGGGGFTTTTGGEYGAGTGGAGCGLLKTMVLLVAVLVAVDEVVGHPVTPAKH
jgi:hypothetical protein